MTQSLISGFAAKNNPASRWDSVRPGMTIRVHQKLKQGEKGKSQIFEGIVVARKHGSEPGASITVRRSVGGYGVEKVYPLLLPSIEKIEVVKSGRTRRAKLYYLREKTAKEIRKKTRAEAVAAKALEATASAAESPGATPAEETLAA